MTKTDNKTNSFSELIAVAELKDVMLRIEHKLDLLLTLSNPSQEQSSGKGPITCEEPDDGWTEDLDGITRFNLERGWMTKEEVKKALKEG